jgi:hypothetical protein
MATKSSGTFVGTANGNVASPDAGQINGALWGTFTATIVLEVSFDGGATWVQAQYPDTPTAVSFTAPGMFTINFNEVGIKWRWRCSAYTSGTVNYRIGQ